MIERFNQIIVIFITMDNLTTDKPLLKKMVVADLEETLINLKDCQPYPNDEPIGFEDKGQFFVVVFHNNKLMKKRIPNNKVTVN